MATCTYCKGKGGIICGKCDGKGYNTESFMIFDVTDVKCNPCGGTGTRKCGVCNGTGKV